MPSTVLSVVPVVPPERGDQWLSLHEVRRTLHASPATIYNLMARDPTFPRPAKLGRASRWSARELAAWMDSKLAARADR
jgi:predicted DNA-binding transcriptional regulator AlpA